MQYVLYMLLGLEYRLYIYLRDELFEYITNEYNKLDLKKLRNMKVPIVVGIH